MTRHLYRGAVNAAPVTIVYVKPTRYQHFVRALCAAIRDRRERQGLSQEDVAYEAGVSIRHYQKIEAGDSLNPKLENLHGIATALEMRLSELIADAERR
jgi:DNA-binding XRE family transcriptional regulator